MKRTMVDRGYPTWGRGNREDASQGGTIQGSGNWEDTRRGTSTRGSRGDASQSGATWGSSNDWDDTRQGGANWGSSNEWDGTRQGGAKWGRSNDCDDARQGGANWGSSNDCDDARQGGANWGSSNDWDDARQGGNDWDDARQGGATWGSSNDWDDTRQGGATWGSSNEWDDTRQRGATRDSSNDWDETRQGGANWGSSNDWDETRQGGATWGSRKDWDYTSQAGATWGSRDGASQGGATWGSSNNWDDTSQGGANWGSRDGASQGGATWGSSNNWDDTSQGGATWASRDGASQGGAAYGSNTWNASQGGAAWGNRGDKSMARDSMNRDVTRGYISRDYITRGNIEGDGARLGNMTSGVLSRGKTNGGDFGHSNMKKDYMSWGNINRGDRDMNTEKHKKLDEPEDDGTFYCEICQITCLSYMNYHSHITGTKHLKKTGLTESSSKLIKSRKTLKDYMDEPVREPLIGLEYVMESSVEGSSDKIYNCELCDFKRELATMLEHLSSFKHRRAYIKKEYPFILEEPRIPKEDKVQFLRRIAAELEQSKGLQMYKIDPLSEKNEGRPLPEINQDEIPIKRSRDQNEMIQNPLHEKAQWDAGTEDWSYDSMVQVAQAQKTVRGNPEKGNSKLVPFAPIKPHGQGGIPTGSNGFGNSFSRFDSGPPPGNMSGGRSRLLTQANSFQRTNPSAAGLSRVHDAPRVENAEAGYLRGLQDRMPFGTSSSMVVPRFLALEKADKKAGPLSAEILNRIRGKDVQSASIILLSLAATIPALQKVNMSNLLNLLVQTGTIIE